METPSKKCRKNIVVRPWYNKNEFLKVKEALFSDDIRDKIWGLKKVEVWRQRSYPCLPACIETTSSIIRAQVEDEMAGGGMCLLGDKKLLSLVYTSAVNEFVNIMTEFGQSNTTPINMKKAAKNIGCPEWLVDLRHQATHSSCPSVEMLRGGANCIYKWLLDNYWNPMCDRVQPPLINPEVINECDYRADEKLINGYKSIQCEVLHSSIMMQSSLKRQRNKILNAIENRILMKNTTFLEALLRPNMFFISLSHLRMFIPGDDIDELVNSETLTLPQSMIIFWAPLIKIINSTHLMRDFVHALLTSYYKLEDIQKKIACSWAFKIVKLAATNGASEANTDPLYKIFAQHNWMLNWLECCTDCIFCPSVYNAPILLEVIGRIYPPLPEKKKKQLTTMFSVFIGIIPPEFEEFIAKRKSRSLPVYTWEDLQDNLGWTSIVEANPAADFKEIKWRYASNNVDWSEVPIGSVFGNCDDFVGNVPSNNEKLDLSKGELTNETNPSIILDMKSLLDNDYEMDDSYGEMNYEIQMNSSENITVSLEHFY